MDEEGPLSQPRAFTLAIVDAGLSLPSLVPQATSANASSSALASVRARNEMATSEGADEDERNLTQHDASRVRDDPFAVASQLSAWATGSGWRAYDNIITSQPIFYPAFSTDMTHRLLTDQSVQHQIRELVKRHLDRLPRETTASRSEKLAALLESQLQDVARNIAKDLVAQMDSIRFLRFFGACVSFGLSRMYEQGINISLDEWRVFRECAQQAAAKKQSLIFLPCHRSHIDYLTISFLAFRLGLALPHIIAGENLDLPVVGSMLKKCGAVFIRRTFGDDQLYGTMVQSYVNLLLSQGHNLEVFIEGTRSRTGKLMAPKFGILSYILEAVLSGKCDDVWLCPISLQYDKVIETESYVNELLGARKEKESLAALLSGSSVLNLKLGRIDVRFQRPFSLSAYVKQQRSRREGTEGAAMDYVGNKEHRALLLRAIGYQVLSEINAIAVIMPAALIGCVLLTIRGRGVGRSELIRRVDWLCKAIVERGGRVASFHGATTGQVVDRALLNMRDVIGEHTDTIEPTLFAHDRFKLSFSRNALIHLFIAEALLCATLYQRVKQGGGPSNQRMPMADVLRELRFLSLTLAGEFVYATEGLAANANATIEQLVQEKVLAVEDDHLCLAPEERLAGRERFDFSCFLVWPFIEGYWAAAVSLFALAPPEEAGALPAICWMGEKAFLESAQLLAKTLFHQGDVSYQEAVNIATLQNAFARYETVGIIRRRRDKASKLPNMIALAPDWQPQRGSDGHVQPTGRLWQYIDSLGAFRREGKNRRDKGTLDQRVREMLRLLSCPVLVREPLVSARL